VRTRTDTLEPAHLPITDEDLVKTGVIDATKVAPTTLQNATSIATLLLIAEAVISEIPEKPKERSGGVGGGKGGMGGMGGDFGRPAALPPSSRRRASARPRAPS